MLNLWVYRFKIYFLSNARGIYDPLLDPAMDRYSLRLPAKHQGVWSLVGLLASEIDLSQDRKDWEHLDEEIHEINIGIFRSK